MSDEVKRAKLAAQEACGEVSRLAAEDRTNMAARASRQGAPAMSAKKRKRECYWCGARVWKAQRITLMGPARRRVYECVDVRRCNERQMRPSV